MKELRICKICNQEFYATNGMQLICKRPHYATCVVCGKVFEIPVARLSASDKAACCSRKCSAALRKGTCQSKYGGNAPAASETVRAKMQDTNMQRFGVPFAAQSPEVMERSRETSRSRYGVDYFLQTKEAQEALNAACERKFNCSWPSQAAEVKSKCKQTSMIRYGVEYPMQAKSIKHHMLRTRMGKDVSEFLKFRENPAQYIEELQLDHKPTIYELSQLLDIATCTVGQTLHDAGCIDLVKLKVSVMEQEVVDAIHEIDPTIQIDMHRRDLIPPKELDIYLPEFKVAIECNPTATHNSTINVFDDSPSEISKWYHRDKSLECSNKGIFLFHIFGPEWKLKQGVIISMLRNLVKHNTDKLYARKCQVVEVSASDCRKFLEANHRQGVVNSPVRLGLTYESNLVAVMTFSKLRHGLKASSDDSTYWELVRFCSLQGLTVVGGAAKLFSRFLKTHPNCSVRSFSDIAHTQGNIYEKLGFKQIRISDPNYIWVDIVTDMYYTRYQTQKHELPKLFDEEIDPSLTEHDIMVQHGFVQVFDCGNIVWEYSPNRYIL